MASADSKLATEKLYSLIIKSENQAAFSKALRYRSFFKYSVTSKWETSSGNHKQKILRYAGFLEVEEGLDIILQGIRYHAINVREEAKVALEKMAYNITIPYDKEKKAAADMIWRSAIFSSSIFEEMKSAIALDETGLFMKILLSIGIRGPFYAWRYFALRVVPNHILVDVIRGFREPLRLAFALEYSKSHIADRLKFGPYIRNVLQEIKDRQSVIVFFAYLFDQSIPLDPLFKELGDKLGIKDHVLKKGITSAKLSDRINGIKIIGLLENVEGYRSCIPFLYPNENLSIRIECLKIFAKSDIPKTPGLIRTLYSLLSDREDSIVYYAFKTLVRLNASGLEKVVEKIFNKFPHLSLMLYERISELELVKMTAVLSKLPKEASKEVRIAFVHSAIQKNHMKMIQFFKQYELISDDDVRSHLISLRNTIENIRIEAIQGFSEYKLPKIVRPEQPKKSLFSRFSNGKQKKDTSSLRANSSIDGMDFNNEEIRDIDLTGIQLNNVSFENTYFSNVNFTSAQLVNVSFKGAVLRNIKMENAFLNSVSFDKAVLANVTSEKACFDTCTFKMAQIYASSFKESLMQGSYFINSFIRKTNFSQVDLTESSFVASDMGIVSFNNAIFHYTDFYGSSLKICEFKGTEISELPLMENVDSHIASDKFYKINIPDNIFDDKKIKSQWFDLLVISQEIEKQRALFLNYNNKRIELSMDTFRPDQRVLFELIPVLLYSNDICFQHKNFSKKQIPKDCPCGIKNYIPSQRVLNLTKEYFNIQVLKKTGDNNSVVEGLYTIGSVGSIAQTEDSDIDYWVCMNESQIEEKNILALKKKFQVIEEWAQLKFDTEIHFFIVDPTEIREDRFGGSDQESSGSAQGKILKEEFYRTMIHIAGKIPFWCVFPAWMDDKYYLFSHKMVSKLDNIYLDLGNVSAIPKEEYFGASIWQLFKSLKSPFKSVMKMGLLEKYIQEEKTSTLLCNQLKSRWISSHADYLYIDPYLLLFEQILDFYRTENQHEAASLIQECFLLKVGVESSKKDMNKSVFGFRKKMINDCIKRWELKAPLINDLKTFKEWPYERTFQFGTKIKDYMLGTYKRLASYLKTSSSGKTLMSSEDLTMLGRKMFVQFAKYPNKVETLPFVSHGSALFEQVRLQYLRKGNRTSWELYSQKKNNRSLDIEVESIKNLERIEEIAIWIVHNGLYFSAKAIQLMPNPTEVLPQDFIDLVAKLQEFFITNNDDEYTPEHLQQKPKVSRLFIVANYSLNRKLEKIHEITAIYLTSWGEMYCNAYSVEKGIISIAQTVEYIKDKIDLPINSAKIGGFVSKQARKRIKVGRGIYT